ncbi:MAG: ABC transporter ATP-binding protein [Phascolarctobacterium sp.]|nr:ABC transporter ATP-binding protein [Phascolarctobacterium sp.]
MSDTVIELKELNIGYEGKTVIQNINASITQGEIIGIIGANGAGKSTLLKTMRGLLPAIGGDTYYFGKSLKEYKDKEIAQKVAYLQQHVEVGFGYTGQDIVLAGRYPYMKWYESEGDKDKELALDCMEYTGTRDLADRPMTEMSGGQKQRVLLAKVLAQQTPILFLDEPTTGLDMVYKEEIFRFARNLGEAGKTVLMVVHELDLAAKYCSRIFLLGEGKLLADGKPEDVYTTDLLNRAYHADVCITRNPLNNNWEISTNVNDLAREKDAKILAKII